MERCRRLRTGKREGRGSLFCYEPWKRNRALRGEEDGRFLYPRRAIVSITPEEKETSSLGKGNCGNRWKENRERPLEEEAPCCREAIRKAYHSEEKREAGGGE